MREVAATTSTASHATGPKMPKATSATALTTTESTFFSALTRLSCSARKMAEDAEQQHAEAGPEVGAVRAGEQDADLQDRRSVTLTGAGAALHDAAQP